MASIQGIIESISDADDRTINLKLINNNNIYYLSRRLGVNNTHTGSSIIAETCEDPRGDYLLIESILVLPTQ